MSNICSLLESNIGPDKMKMGQESCNLLPSKGESPGCQNQEADSELHWWSHSWTD